MKTNKRVAIKLGFREKREAAKLGLQNYIPIPTRRKAEGAPIHGSKSGENDHRWWSCVDGGCVSVVIRLRWWGRGASVVVGQIWRDCLAV